jgi:hypothetical protein
MIFPEASAAEAERLLWARQALRLRAAFVAIVSSRVDQLRANSVATRFGDAELSRLMRLNEQQSARGSARMGACAGWDADRAAMVKSGV